MENQETKPETKPKTSSMFEGVSSQINLGPQSELHKRFAKLYNTSGREVSPKEFVAQMMTAFENQSTDNSEVVADLEQTIADLRSEIASYEATLQNQEMEIDQLNEQLQTARTEANEAALKVQSIQLSHSDGEICFVPNPVVAHFLNDMAASTGKTPAYVLEKLFMDDLQNPRANNLPYTVSASDIRKVMAEIKKADDDGE